MNFKRITYYQLTDLDMNLILRASLPSDYVYRGDVLDVYIQGYSDDTYDVVLVREVGSSFIQGTTVGGRKIAITKVSLKKGVVVFNLKTSPSAKTLRQAKTCFSELLPLLIEKKYQ